MKKYLFIVLLVGFCFGQKLYFGLDLSKNIYNNKDYSDLYTQSYFSGYQLGFEQSYKNFHFGLGANHKGNISKVDDTQIEVIDSYDYFSFHLIYSSNILDKIKPIVGFSVGGHVIAKNILKVDGIENYLDMDMTNPYSAIIGCDYYFSPQIGFRLAYSRILNNLVENIDDDLNRKNHSLSFSLLYMNN
tara:strand:+ start:449 stop:1012 length:564 start_codon:yes stop_codon:yes gene_type:complete